MAQHPLQQSNNLSRRTRRIHLRKLDILKAAARLFAERGYERTTLLVNRARICCAGARIWAHLSLRAKTPFSRQLIQQL